VLEIGLHFPTFISVEDALFKAMALVHRAWSIQKNQMKVYFTRVGAGSSLWVWVGLASGRARMCRILTN